MAQKCDMTFKLGLVLDYDNSSSDKQALLLEYKGLKLTQGKLISWTK